MQIIRVKDYTEMSQKAALLMAGQIMAKRDSVLGLATGSTPIGAYQELVRMHKEANLDFSQVITYNLDEYYDSPVTDKNSYYNFMHENLFNHINMKPESIHLPDGMAKDAAAECARYEAAIEAEGGIDLQLLGIGHNGHIGFNEPADSFAASTQHIQLTESTINANARFYSSRDQVPTTALSMGIGTIMKAKRILLIASGKEKAEIMRLALTGPVTPQVPASILQFHHDVIVITDTE